jgi:hypothetical protein
MGLLNTHVHSFLYLFFCYSTVEEQDHHLYDNCKLDSPKYVMVSLYSNFVILRLIEEESLRGDKLAMDILIGRFRCYATYLYFNSLSKQNNPYRYEKGKCIHERHSSPGVSLL